MNTTCLLFFQNLIKNLNVCSTTVKSQQLMKQAHNFHKQETKKKNSIIKLCLNSYKLKLTKLNIVNFFFKKKKSFLKTESNRKLL